jgi:hypothetical protein
LTRVLSSIVVVVLIAATPASARATRFIVSYIGTGTYHTTYHSNPPNPGGNPDTNDANDSSTQSWSLTFINRLVLPGCRRGRCPRIAGLHGATGATAATGHIAHTHIDGLYPAQNGSVSCTVQASTPPAARLDAAVSLRYLPARRSVLVEALIPVGNVLTLLPPQCPGQGDSLDGLADNYFTPGFSFAPGFGPGRWFRSRTVSIPLTVLRRAARISIRLGPARAGTPPSDCAVPHPDYQRCSTGGSWSGTLTLRRAS